jgi:cell wall-associated NlpC family hydrolase
MHPTDQTPRALVSGTIDPSAAASAVRTGRRRADAVPSGDVAGATSRAASLVSIDASVSPRRAARAAREAAAAAAFSSIVDGDVLDSEAPASPAVAPTAALPIVPAAVPAAPVSPVVAPAAVVSPAASVGPAAVAESVTLAASVGPAVTVGPAAVAGSLAVGIPAPARNGRRETFVPSAATPESRPVRVDRAHSSSRRTATAPASTPARVRRRSVGTVIRRGAIGAVICGILATSVLPVLGHTGSSKAFASTNPDGTTTVHIGKQTYDVAAGVDNQVLARDGYSATSVIDYEKQVIANREASTSSTYTGPTAAEYVLHPLYSKTPLDRAQVFDVALQYLGTPYVHGGADPSAFDCSGFIMFVYAQFGISLPHYVPSQDAMGTTIPESEAVPGDLVIFNTDDHDGFYAGNGMIMDAPKPGGVITVRPIWDAPHHFVRINP